MSWISLLNETYNNCSALIGKELQAGKTPLLPIGHSTQNAQVEVDLDANGNLLAARRLEKPEATIIPVTEDSASRTAGFRPHPLFDKLQYVAGDYEKYGGKKGKDSYLDYMKQLNSWCESYYCHPKVAVVYKYLQKGSLVSDLIAKGVLDYDTEAGKFNEDSELESFVRFRVFIEGDPEARVWLDQDVWKSFSDFNASIQEGTDLCYVQGIRMPITSKHAKKIRNSGDGAKLISANDTSGFTFRGRFDDKAQVVSVGYETSHKAFNMLTWLVNMQGYRNDSQVILAFSTANEELPKGWEEDDIWGGEVEEVDFVNIDQDYAKKLKSSIAGYKQNLTHSSKVVVMGLDSATPGRLSITFYRELFPFEYLERIEDWYKKTAWLHTYKFVDKKPYEWVGAPAPKEIAQAAFGSKASKEVIKETIERLLPCIIDGRRIPRDLVLTINRRASNPVALEPYEWLKVLSIACAVNKNFYQKENISMALDETITDRNYLFGRLLAVADKIESSTYERGENRQTNAIRYMNMFSRNPFRTWEIIWKRLIPYMAKAGPWGVRYQDLISDIMAKFDYEDYSKNEALNGKYLLGFHNQRQVFIEDRKANIEKKLQEKLEIQ
ncbi:MAG: type I-C CRISPR-associated protein Cas8c/Csd1 [Chloroflexi bacterium 44-23]|nr:MAG: type I-C CRISPR-associated protein Cas8c/Csd1 [Chloroflexi bacterium 44-23]